MLCLILCSATALTGIPMEAVVKAVVGVVCMLKGGNNILLNECCVTNRAMLTLGKTTLGTGGGNRLINNLGMTLGVDGCLCKEYQATVGAMLTLGKTTLGTGGSNGLVNNLGMTLWVDGCLCNYYRVTNRAMLTLGKTALGTGGSNSLVNNLGMLAVRRESLGLFFATVTVSCHFALIGAGNLLYGNPFAKAMCMGVATVNVTRNKANAKRKYKRH